MTVVSRVAKKRILDQTRDSEMFLRVECCHLNGSAHFTHLTNKKIEKSPISPITLELNLVWPNESYIKWNLYNRHWNCQFRIKILGTNTLRKVTKSAERYNFGLINEIKIEPSILERSTDEKRHRKLPRSKKMGCWIPFRNNYSNNPFEPHHFNPFAVCTISILEFDKNIIRPTTWSYLFKP